MSLVDDLPTDGLEPSWYEGIPETVLEELNRAARGEQMRILTNPVTGWFTVIVRSQGVVTQWHGGYMRNWAICFHWEEALGDGHKLALLIANAVALRDYKDAAAAEAAIDKMIAEKAERAQAEDDQRLSDFVDSEYPSTSVQADALNRDVERRDEKARDNAHAGRAHRQGPKLLVPKWYAAERAAAKESA